MTSLPFIVVHGALVGKVLFAMLVGATFGVGYAIRRMRASVRERGATTARLATVAGLRDGEAVIRGSLGGGAVTAKRLPDATETEPVDAERWITCDGERIELAGKLRIDAGTKLAGAHRPLALHYTIADRADVVVTGRLSRAPAAGEGGYRDGAAAWTLSGDPIAIAAATPQARPFPRSIASIVSRVVVASIVWISLMSLFGARWKKFDDYADRRVPISIPTTLQIAAALPGARSDALSGIDYWIENSVEKSDATEAFRDELYDARDQHCDRAYHHDTARRLEQSPALAKECGLGDLLGYLLLDLGRYAEAHALPTTSQYTRVMTSIATDHWVDAAVAVDSIADEHRKGGVPSYTTPESDTSYLNHLRCLAGLFRYWGGDTHVLESLPGGGTCELVRSFGMDAPSQLAALESIDFTHGPNEYGFAGLHARQIAQTMGGKRDAYTTYDLDEYGIGSTDLWLAAFQTTQHDDGWHESMAVLSAIRNDYAAARADAAAIVDPHRRAERELEIALHAGDSIAPDVTSERVHAKQRLAIRRTGEIGTDPLEALSPRDCGADLSRAFVAAHDGDGAPLARVLRQCNVYWIYVPRLLPAVLPLVTKHRDELADALRHYHGDHAIGSPARRLPGLVTNRQLAHLVGDEAEAKGWQAIIDRHVAALSDRKRVIAFALWDL